MVTSLEALDICSERCQLSAASRKRLSPLRLTQSTSNLSALLERARLSFATGGATAGSQNSSHVTSDSGVTSSQAAEGGASPVVLSPLLQSFIAGLPSQHEPHSSHRSPHRHQRPLNMRAGALTDLLLQATQRSVKCCVFCRSPSSR